MRPKGVVDGHRVDIPELVNNRYHQSRDAESYIAGLIGLPSKEVDRECR